MGQGAGVGVLAKKMQVKSCPETRVVFSLLNPLGLWHYIFIPCTVLGSGAVASCNGGDPA